MSAQSFGNYQLVKKLATGGMAEVWLAKQTGIEGFNRHVVVKRILPHLAEDPEFVQMFLNEARIASRFNHPNIGQIYDLGEKDGQYFIAMEFIHGEDLGRVMRRAWSTGQWVARHIALRIVADACAGLYYAHTRNDDQGRPLKVVHRDISPQNILISFDGAVKVLDFGIAKASDQVSNTKSGAIKGKFAYMAPEQAAGKALDARSDVFALGLVLYELVTGVRPLKRDSELATLQAALECAIDPPSAVAEIPPELDGVVMRALAKSPDDRYGDAREFQRALESFLLNSKELSTSAEVSELMAALFADRLNEEARLGTPNPATESSTSNPVASSYSAASAPQQATPGPSAPRAGVRASPALTIDQEDSEVSAPDDGGAVALGGGYELPAGTVLPTRAYSAQKAVRNEETRASMPDVEPVPAQPPRRKTVSRPAAASASDEASPAAAPRRPSQLVQRKTGGGLAMPEAPPRSKSRTANAAAQRPSEVALDKFVDLKGLKEKQNSRLKALVAVILLLAAVGGIVVFRDRILAMLNKTALATDGTPVLLTVTSNPTTEVVVMPGPTAKGRKPVSLGRTPITEQSGAFIGDIVVLKNLDRGLYFEVPVVSKEANPTPNTLIVIDKVFREVGVRVRVNPPLRDAEIYRGELKAGVPNLPLNLMPGVHKLEIRSNQLADPCPFEVRIQDGSSSIDWKVDVTPCLKKK